MFTTANAPAAQPIHRGPVLRCPKGCVIIGRPRTSDARAALENMGTDDFDDAIREHMNAVHSPAAKKHTAALAAAAHHAKWHSNPRPLPMPAPRDRLTFDHLTGQWVEMNEPPF